VALPRIGAVLAERQGTITNDIAAAEELKQRAIEAEAAYDKASRMPVPEAGKIVAQAQADIQSELDVQIKPTQRSRRKRLKAKKSDDIQAGATDAVKAVAKTPPKRSLPRSVAKQTPRRSLQPSPHG
jgi:F-type H+-transporting ATPase subunit b